MERNIKKNINIVTNIQILTLSNFVKNGNKITNSTSKIRKIMANKKNRRLKGKVPRLEELNPHSKGLSCSRSNDLFLVSKYMTQTKTPPRINLNIIIIKFEKIKT
jgi:hypothetical protein